MSEYEAEIMFEIYEVSFVLGSRGQADGPGSCLRGYLNHRSFLLYLPISLTMHR